MHTIVIDIVLGVLTLKTPFIEKTYPVVVPRENALHHYQGKREFNVNQIGLNVGWIDSNGKLIPGNSPKNPLGAGRIRFQDASTSNRPCSIHGGALPRDLGRKLSGCCIRMLDEDFMELVFEVTYDTKILMEGR